MSESEKLSAFIQTLLEEARRLRQEAEIIEAEADEWRRIQAEKEARSGMTAEGAGQGGMRSQRPVNPAGGSA